MNFRKFAAEFVRIALARGMQIGVPQIEPVNGIDALTSMRRPPNASIVMYVGNEANESHGMHAYLSRVDKNSFSEKLKYWESESRILTQHVPTSVVSKMDPRVLNDLAAKMNAKMGGFSYRPSLGYRPSQGRIYLKFSERSTSGPSSSWHLLRPLRSLTRSSSATRLEGSHPPSAYPIAATTPSSGFVFNYGCLRESRRGGRQAKEHNWR